MAKTKSLETQPVDDLFVFVPEMTSITIVSLYAHRRKVVASINGEIATTEFLLKQAEKALKMTLDQLEKEKEEKTK